MSVVSYGFKNVGVIVIEGEYKTPRMKVNKHGQISYIDDLGGGQIDPEDLQTEYNALLEQYNQELATYNDINDGIDQYEQTLIDDVVAPLNTASADMTTASTDLTTALNNYTPFNYYQLTVLSSQLPTTTFKFSNIEDKPEQQQLQTIYSNLSVPAGNYLVSVYLCYQATGGDVSKIRNSGSSMTIVLSDSGNPNLFYTLIQTGTASTALETVAFTRQQASGQQYVSFAQTTNVDFRFCISQGATVGQPSFEEFGISYALQQYANIGSGYNFVAGQLEPTQFYKCLSFIKI
jgi:hypothetical protein